MVLGWSWLVAVLSVAAGGSVSAWAWFTRGSWHAVVGTPLVSVVSWVTVVVAAAWVSVVVSAFVVALVVAVAVSASVAGEVSCCWLRGVRRGSGSAGKFVGCDGFGYHLIQMGLGCG